MALERDQKVLDEVSKTVSNIKKEAGLCGNNSVTVNFLNEDLNKPGVRCLVFEQVSSAVMDETEELFYLSRVCDRFAPQYLKICKTLEKAVDYLGHAFITKVALIEEKQKAELPKSLSAERLNEMISTNFIKCQEALHEKKEKLHEYDLDYFNQMLSFAKVMDRLRVTQRKAFDIYYGYIDNCREQAREGNAFTDRDKNRKLVSNYWTPSPFRDAMPYWIDQDVVADHKEQGARDKETVVSGQDSGARGQENEEGRMKNEVDSGIQEQGTRGKDSVVGGQGNEEGRMKNEVDSEIQEQGTRGKDSGSRDQDGSNDEDNSSSFIHNSSLEDNSSSLILPSSLSPPDYREILFRAAERSEGSEDGAITFTDDEVLTLIADPLFLSNEPELAEDIRKALST